MHSRSFDCIRSAVYKPTQNVRELAVGRLLAQAAGQAGLRLVTISLALWGWGRGMETLLRQDHAVGLILDGTH